MKFDEIIALLKANPNDSDWNRGELDNVWISYCLADVDLRSEFRIVWESGKPLADVRYYYRATLVLKFSLPLVRGNVADISLADVINKASGELTKLVQGKAGR